MKNRDRQQEHEWFAKRMTITTREGMLRQYQLEEEMRGYKIETLEFRSPEYILKNYIAGMKRRSVEKRYQIDRIQALESSEHCQTLVAESPKRLRRMTNRNAVCASVENTLYLLKTSYETVVEAAYSPNTRVRTAFACACALLIAAVSYAALVQYQNNQGESYVKPPQTAHRVQRRHTTL